MDCILSFSALFFLVQEIACYCQVVPYGIAIYPRDPKTVGAPKRVITGIKGPHNILITRSGDVYITGYFDRFLYRLDLAGNILEKFKFPAGNPFMLDMRGDTLYITNVAKTVYSKQIFGHQPFRPFLTNLNWRWIKDIYHRMENRNFSSIWKVYEANWYHQDPITR